MSSVFDTTYNRWYHHIPAGLEAMNAINSASKLRTSEYPDTQLRDPCREIRLLTLFPGKRNDPIIGRLEHASFDQNLRSDINYEALSYAWGREDASSYTIQLNGVDFNIRENLFTALKYVRDRSTPRVLWIDAICINQLDVDERSHQVEQMADIYSNARRVLAWLGSETATSRDAFDFLRKAASFDAPTRDQLKEDLGWKALEDLSQREYWKRVWIVQEICLGPHVTLICGADQIPWRYLSELRKARMHIWPQNLSQGERAFMKSLPARIDYQRHARQRSNCILWAVLETFMYSQCQDIHDKIYGFLGLSNDCGGRGLPISYSKSVRELFEDVMVFYQEKFSRDDPSPSRGAQLMALAEFLQSLLESHPNYDKNFRESTATYQTLEPSSFPLAPSAMDECCVCVDDIHLGDEMAVLRCSHWFHKGCVSAWLAEHKTCPICRQPVEAQQLVLVPLSRTSPVVHIPAYRITVIRSFPSSKDAAKGVLSDLRPWGYFSRISDIKRDIAELDCRGIATVNSATAHFESHLEILRLEDQISEKVARPTVFIAERPGNPAIMVHRRIVGIAPGGSQTGDLVIEFLDSSIILVMRPSKSHPKVLRQQDFKTYEVMDARKCALVGRAVIVHAQDILHPRLPMAYSLEEQDFQSRIRPDKTVETTQLRATMYPQSLPFPGILSIDPATLQFLQRVKSFPVSVGPPFPQASVPWSDMIEAIEDPSVSLTTRRLRVIQ
jgi:hypothetical protein